MSEGRGREGEGSEGGRGGGKAIGERQCVDNLKGMITNLVPCC